MLTIQSCDYYSDMYAHYGAHEDLLKDKPRMNAYCKAILENQDFFKNKTVLDAGTGTGIMALLAAKAGAKKVYAVERTVMAEYAQKIVQINGYGDTITVIKADLETVELPEKVDIIISDWMGYALFANSSIKSVLIARDRFLKPDGVMFPSQARLFISAGEDQPGWSDKVDFWNNVYGFSYDYIKKWTLVEPLIQRSSKEELITEPCLLASFDLKTMKFEDMEKEYNFTLMCNSENVLTEFILWFDVIFRTPDRAVVLSTSPSSRRTSWYDSHFYLQNHVQVNQLSVIDGTVSQQNEKQHESNQLYQFHFSVEGTQYDQKFKMTA